LPWPDRPGRPYLENGGMATEPNKLVALDGRQPWLVAAARSPDGKIHYGRTDETHSDLEHRLYNVENISRETDLKLGFANDKGQFLDQVHAWGYAEKHDLLDQDILRRYRNLGIIREGSLNSLDVTCLKSHSLHRPAIGLGFARVAGSMMV
jgi:hypothetical protein